MVFLSKMARFGIMVFSKQLAHLARSSTLVFLILMARSLTLVFLRRLARFLKTGFLPTIARFYLMGLLGQVAIYQSCPMAILKLCALGIRENTELS